MGCPGHLINVSSTYVMRKDKKSCPRSTGALYLTPPGMSELHSWSQAIFKFVSGSEM